MDKMSKIDILLVGGHDPTGGAGIVADVKTVEILGCNPLTVITSLIPQNNRRVYSKLDVPRDVIEDQLQAIFEDFQVSVVKTGVLTEDAIDILLDYQGKYNFKIVCDPVLRSTTGYNFIDEGTFEKYFELFKRSFLIMPNSQEYHVIKRSKHFQDLERGDTYILVTGIEDKLLYRGRIIRKFKGRKIDREVHGTGCVFASAVASFIGRGYNIIDAIEEGKRVVMASVLYATKTKYGYNVNPIYIDREKVLKNLYYAFHLMKDIDLPYLTEEDSISIGECLILPRDVEDVASLKVRGRVIEDVKFGAPNTLSKILTTVNCYHPKIRGGMILRYTRDMLKDLREQGFKPLPLNTEGGIEEGVKVLCENFKGIPDVLYFMDRIVVLGEDGADVVRKLRCYNSL